MKILKMTNMFLLIATSAIACHHHEAQITAYEKTTEKIDTNQTDLDSVSFLTITRVKKPRYAWRGLVVGKMKETIPEYQVVNGFQQKFFTFTQDHKIFGGIYLWANEQDAKNWFSQDWYDRIEDKYGAPGIVDNYEVQRIQQFDAKYDAENDNWIVLSSAIDFSLEELNKTEGLLMLISLVDGQEKFYLSIWKTKKMAEDLKTPSVELSSIRWKLKNRPKEFTFCIFRKEKRIKLLKC